MTDTDKLVAAIMAAAKAAAEKRKTHDEYLEEFNAFVAALQKRGRQSANTVARGVAAAARTEAER